MFGGNMTWKSLGTRIYKTIQGRCILTFRFPSIFFAVKITFTYRLFHKINLLVALKLACRRHSEEAVRPRVVSQRAGQQETREEPAKGVAVLLEEHQHPIHGLDAQGLMT